MKLVGPWGEQIAAGAVTLERGEWFEVRTDSDQLVMVVEVDRHLEVHDDEFTSGDIGDRREDIVIKRVPRFPQLGSAWFFVGGHVFGPQNANLTVHLKCSFVEPLHVWVQFEAYLAIDVPTTIVSDARLENHRIVSGQKGRKADVGSR